MTRTLNADGSAVCKDCGRKVSFSSLENCSDCSHWVCKSCATYRRQQPYGYVCGVCYRRSIKS